MPINRLPFDLTPDDREAIQLMQADLDLHPERLPALLAELHLSRQVLAWARAHQSYFPPRLRASFHVLARRTVMERVIADSREEIDA
jgi:hypothetical protein